MGIKGIEIMVESAVICGNICSVNHWKPEIPLTLLACWSLQFKALVGSQLVPKNAI